MPDQVTTKHGQREQGPTKGRTNSTPHGGMEYYDTDLNTLMYWDSVLEEWRPQGMPSYANAAAAPAALKAIEGALIFDQSLNEITFTDGVVWVDPATAEESSSSDSSESSST